jgi:hypothetical protein
VNLRARWHDFWYADVPAIRLDVFRQALLYTLAFYMLQRWMYADEWLTSAGFHPSAAADGQHTPLLPLLRANLLWPFGAVLFGSIALVLFDRLRRPATWVVLAAVIYVSLADPISSFTLNRMYVFSLLVLAVTPDGPTIPAWPIRMLQLTLLTHYFASGLCKALHGDWLKYHDVLWMQIQGYYMTDAAAWMVRTLPAWTFEIQQHMALGFELLAPILLGVRRLRWVGITIGITMHVLIAVTMYQLIYFSLQMMCAYVLFIDSATLARWRARLFG